MISVLIELERALRTLGTLSPVKTAASQTSQLEVFPKDQEPAPFQSEQEKKHIAGLMRVNHVGEVCAQALYSAQSLTARSPEERAVFLQAAAEEESHLTWTHQRLIELNDRRSYLTPLWYAGAFGIGLAAGLLSKERSMGFMNETERQVEAHLDGHLQQIPVHDTRSRAMIERMKQDEIEHQHTAIKNGATQLPAIAKGLMKLSAKVMTSTSYRI
jgi:ubiquinone biosynthesis monooxygenase Coq7